MHEAKYFSKRGLPMIRKVLALPFWWLKIALTTFLFVLTLFATGLKVIILLAWVMETKIRGNNVEDSTVSLS